MQASRTRESIDTRGGRARRNYGASHNNRSLTMRRRQQDQNSEGQITQKGVAWRSRYFEVWTLAWEITAFTRPHQKMRPHANSHRLYISAWLLNESVQRLSLMNVGWRYCEFKYLSGSTYKKLVKPNGPKWTHWLLDYFCRRKRSCLVWDHHWAKEMQQTWRQQPKHAE